QTEPDNRIRALWELHLNMEIEHLRIACQMQKEVEGIDPESYLPAAGMPEPLTFQSNKEYLRDVLARTIEWAPYDAQFVPVGDLPPEHRFFEYQRKVNAGEVPSVEVIDRHRAHFGAEYRSMTEGPHPVEALRENGSHEAFAYDQAIAREPALEEA